MAKKVGYIRVSTKEQNLDRQIKEMYKLGIEEKYIYQDKQSGKDFERIGYQYMKRTLEAGDTLVIKELDRLGRNQQELKREWEYFRNNEINVRVLDMPALNINYDDEAVKPIARMISNIIFEVMAWKAEDERTTIRKRQKEGIAIARAKGVSFGRPTVAIPDNYEEVIARWKIGEITATKAMELTGIKKTTFYKKVKEYNIDRINS